MKVGAGGLEAQALGGGLRPSLGREDQAPAGKVKALRTWAV